MPKTSRPRLTCRVIRGLRVILPLVDVELRNGEFGAFCQGFRDTPLSDVSVAVEFLDRLLAWYDEGHAHNP
jgi:hypothetical protein